MDGIESIELVNKGGREVVVHMDNGEEVHILPCHESWEQYGAPTDTLQKTVDIAEHYNEWLHGGRISLKEWVERICDENEWNSNAYDGMRDDIDFELESYTSRGQDLIVSISVNDNATYEDFVKELEDYYEDYDPDEEASKWIGPDGHGANGAPYRITDIVHDMEEAREMIGDLLKAFKNNL